MNFVCKVPEKLNRMKQDNSSISVMTNFIIAAEASFVGAFIKITFFLCNRQRNKGFNNTRLLYMKNK